MRPIGDQFTAETWEIAGEVINLSKMPVLFKDENGIYHTIDGGYQLEIVNGETEYVVLSGEIVEPQPLPPAMEITENSGDVEPQ